RHLGGPAAFPDGCADSGHRVADLPRAAELASGDLNGLGAPRPFRTAPMRRNPPMRCPTIDLGTARRGLLGRLLIAALVSAQPCTLAFTEPATPAASAKPRAPIFGPRRPPQRQLAPSIRGGVTLPA